MALITLELRVQSKFAPAATTIVQDSASASAREQGGRPAGGDSGSLCAGTSGQSPAVSPPRVRNAVLDCLPSARSNECSSCPIVRPPAPRVTTFVRFSLQRSACHAALVRGARRHHRPGGRTPHRLPGRLLPLHLPRPPRRRRALYHVLGRRWRARVRDVQGSGRVPPAPLRTARRGPALRRRAKGISPTPCYRACLSARPITAHNGQNTACRAPSTFPSAAPSSWSATAMR